MTTISGNTRTLVLSDSDITDIVGTKCYPVVFPANAEMPCITYQVISGYHDLLAAPVPTAPDMTTRFQFSCWALSYDETQDMKDALVDRFNRYSGTVNGQIIYDTKIDLTFDLYEDESMLYRHIVDVSMTHKGA
jgi:hypothetical protein